MNFLGNFSLCFAVEVGYEASNCLSDLVRGQILVTWKGLDEAVREVGHCISFVSCYTNLLGEIVIMLLVKDGLGVLSILNFVLLGEVEGKNVIRVNLQKHREVSLIGNSFA